MSEEKLNLDKSTVYSAVSQPILIFHIIHTKTDFLLGEILLKMLGLLQCPSDNTRC